jgi:hypothetical protein
MAATVSADVFSREGFAGWIGFIFRLRSSRPDSSDHGLRTSLVYESGFVTDAQDRLRLGISDGETTVGTHKHHERKDAAQPVAKAPRAVTANDESSHSITRSPPLWARDACKTFHTPAGEPAAQMGVPWVPAGSDGTGGPDGAGKTTLLDGDWILERRCGAAALGIDVARDPAQVQARVAYMPQRFGLYEDLSVQNLDLYADLHGVSEEDKCERYLQLLRMTGGGFYRSSCRPAVRWHETETGTRLRRAPRNCRYRMNHGGRRPLSRRELWKLSTS